ncbi:DUF89 domain-containing protein [Coprinopsis marcescibilis]|uniref:Sugar phosphate phosphatase n=1 Tax=Coprinopsis marcescibilis TaxID=230819 RepID=A0A5C3L6U7_COPMA|nr:DUF89 domain-containing protein [Coprinopsis marcescibilis]
MSFKAPYPPYDPLDTAGYDTVIRRWPIIITSVIDELHNKCHFLSLQLKDSAEEAGKAELEESVAEGNQIIGKISKLKYEMARDRELEPIDEDGEPNVEVYNKGLEELKAEAKNTWFTAPWLYAECYLYRLLRSYFTATKHWKLYDPFLSSKTKTFKHSGDSVYKLATTVYELAKNKDELRADPAKIEVIFKEMIQMCLWGNATDLSLLTHLTEDDIKNLQTVGKDAQAVRSKFILKDDQEEVWNHVKGLKGARVDFVLDNAGFELFTDLVFADFLVTYTPFVSKVVFHPKVIPWFVSDVLPVDFVQTIEQLLDPTFFSDLAGKDTSAAVEEHLHAMAKRWRTYVEQGVFELSVPLESPIGVDAEAAFWTSPYPYWNLQELSPALADDLKKSGLVIFKGDLNYRKLTGDVKWPSWTPFIEAIGPLAGLFPLLSLRTNKADVAVGVPKEVSEKLDQEGEKWRVDGRYALISFVPATK